MLRLKNKIIENRALRKMNVAVSADKIGISCEKRNRQVIISMTSFPARINSVHKTIITLLNQDFLPDRVILWLAEEQFSDKEHSLPKNLLKLKKNGLEIKWYHDIKAYKKLIPALIEFPDAIIVTVDDDWYYSSSFLRVLMEEHKKFPDEVICHAITHPYLDQDGKLRTSREVKDYRGISSYFNKLLGGSGVLFPPDSLDKEVINEEVFMELAPTNDDIWFWGMAVKKGTKIRLAAKAEGLLLMTDPEIQNAASLASINSIGNTYEKVTNRILERYPAVYQRLKGETPIG